jgi:RNA polymerase sigma factor (sigma-70 family)
MRQARKFVGKNTRKSGDAEDLVQSTLREAWMRRSTDVFEHEGQRRAWLSKVLYHKAVRWVRGRASADAESGVFHSAPSREASPSEYLQTSEQPQDLQLHLRRLDERTRRIIHLRFVEQLRFAEIGAIVDVSEQHARAIFSRGIRELQERAGEGAERP